jgi:hypothetical protein
MKRQISGIFLILILMTLNFACAKRTVVTTQQHKDNGKHKGWYKNPKNPHHPANARNTGGNNTTVVINNSNNNKIKANNGNSVKPGNGKAHVNAKPGNGNGKGNGNTSKGSGGNGNGKGNSKK